MPQRMARRNEVLPVIPARHFCVVPAQPPAGQTGERQYNKMGDHDGTDEKTPNDRRIKADFTQELRILWKYFFVVFIPCQAADID